MWQWPLSKQQKTHRNGSKSSAVAEGGQTSIVIKWDRNNFSKKSNQISCKTQEKHWSRVKKEVLLLNQQIQWLHTCIQLQLVLRLLWGRQQHSSREDPSASKITSAVTISGRRSLRKTNARKALGPDDNLGRVLRDCAELRDVFINIFLVAEPSCCHKVPKSHDPSSQSQRTCLPLATTTTAQSLSPTSSWRSFSS